MDGSTIFGIQNNSPVFNLIRFTDISGVYTSDTQLIGSAVGYVSSRYSGLTCNYSGNILLYANSGSSTTKNLYSYNYNADVLSYSGNCTLNSLNIIPSSTVFNFTSFTCENAVCIGQNPDSISGCYYSIMVVTVPTPNKYIFVSSNVSPIYGVSYSNGGCQWTCVSTIESISPPDGYIKTQVNIQSSQVINSCGISSNNKYMFMCNLSSTIWVSTNYGSVGSWVAIKPAGNAKYAFNTGTFFYNDTTLTYGLYLGIAINPYPTPPITDSGYFMYTYNNPNWT
jgi:hypothetical protein